MRTATSTVVALALVLAASATVRGAGGPAGGRASAPSGLIAVGVYKPGAPPFSDAIFGDSLISGVDLLAEWKSIEPKNGLFEWSGLDRVFRQAAPSSSDPAGKFVVLTLIPGFGSPSWALKGVPAVTSSFAYGTPAARRPLPQPWNGKYLSRWFGFLRAVAARYGGDPELRMVAAAGPTSVSSETTLPNWASGDTGLPTKLAGVSLHGSDLKMWMAWKYTPAKLARAWGRVFAEYHRLFARQVVSLAIYPGLPIGSRSAPDPSQKTATPLRLVAAGERYRPRFALQNNGLSGAADHTGSMYHVVEDRCRRDTTGFQTLVPSKIVNLSKALRQGVDAGVAFLEIYASQVSSEHNTLKPVAPQLPAIEHCTV